MSCMDPTRRRNSNEIMTKVDKNINQIPLNERVGLRVVAPIYEAVKRTKIFSYSS